MQEGRTRDDPVPGYRYWYALVDHKLGEHEKAAQMFEQAEAAYLERAQSYLEAPAATSVRDVNNGYWHTPGRRSSHASASLVEVRGQDAPEDPWHHLIVARGHRLLGEIDNCEAELAAAVAAAPENAGRLDGPRGALRTVAAATTGRGRLETVARADRRHLLRPDDLEPRCRESRVIGPVCEDPRFCWRHRRLSRILQHHAREVRRDTGPQSDAVLDCVCALTVPRPCSIGTMHCEFAQSGSRTTPEQSGDVDRTWPFCCAERDDSKSRSR